MQNLRLGAKELRVLACLASVSVAAATANVRNTGLVALRAQSLTGVVGYDDGRPQAVNFGDTRCPCIGFDNIEGETTVVFEDGEGETIAEVAYPADLGSRCEAWDNGRHHECTKGGKPGLDKGWCKQSWCYIDPCNCKIPVLPKVSQYSPDALYRGKPLFFSYNTCGGKDTWSKAIPEVGTPGCRCIGFDNVPGTTDMEIDGKSVAYPAEVGGSCQAWDKDTHPECKSEKAPKWCFQRWCYVDPCSCSLPKDTVPKISAYLPEATFTGKSIYYSYETCGEKDTYTAENNEHACVNQDNKEDCEDLDRCAWTGKKCLGAELINHPLCKGVASDYEAKDDDEKSGAGLTTPALLSTAAFLVTGIFS